MASLEKLTPQYLHTARLTLERFNHSPEHYQCLLSTFNSSTAHATMGDYGVRTPEQFDAIFLTARLRGPKFTNGMADDYLYYLVRLGAAKPDGELIGGVTLGQHASSEMVFPPDIGWAFTEAHMGKGYATEAARELLRWAIEGFGAAQVVVFPGTHNPASNRVAEKLGFVEGGQIPDLDMPGRTYSVWILPGMERVEIKGGLSVKSGS